MSTSPSPRARAVGINHIALGVDDQTDEMTSVYFGDQFINFIRNRDRQPDRMRF